MPRPPVRARQHSRLRTPKRNNAIKNALTPKSINEKLESKPVGKRPEDSDDSDGLVTRGNCGRRGAFLRTQEVFASGAVGRSDQPNAHPTRAQRQKQMQDAIRSHSKSSSPATSRERSVATSPKAPLTFTAPSVQQPRPAPVIGRTPLREDSVLNGIRPRKRQNSILRSPELEDSTLNSSLLLPQDENSPLNLPKHTSVHHTPASEPHSSASKKRKLDSNDVPVLPAAGMPNANNQVDDLSAPPTSIPKPSNKKKQRKTLEIDETDIMAPPMSSSSPHSSPAKTPAPAPKKKTKAALVTLKTEELQAQLMPSRRQKQLRDRNRTTTEFDIPSDTDSPAQLEEGDSTFMAPNRRKTKQRQSSKSKANKSKKLQPTRRKADKNSTAPPPLLTSPRPMRDSTTKPHSQLSSANTVSPPRETQSRTRSTRGLKATSGPAAKQLAPFKPSTTRNTGFHPKSSSSSGSYKGTVTSQSTGGDEEDKENSPQHLESHEDESEMIEVQIGRRGDHADLADGDDDNEGTEMSLPSPPSLPRQKFGGKWAAIDDFEMDFEDVSLGSESSDPMAR